MQRLSILLVLILFGTLSALAQSQPAPTLRIVTDNPTLPSELYYGNSRVVPVRMRPGTNKPITIDDADFFVYQHYIDFLSRMPDPNGQSYWTGQITMCGGDVRCVHNRRIDISAAFFIEQEFQQTGYVVYLMYKAGLGRQPSYVEFQQDRAQVVGSAPLSERVRQYAAGFVERSEYRQRYGSELSAEQYVDRLLATAGLSGVAGLREELVGDLQSGRKDRAQVLVAVTERAEIRQREYNAAFVLMQYFGYLRRDPDAGGDAFWLDVLNNRVPGNYRSMVCAFITSTEYQLRFGSAVTRSNRDCGP